MGNAGHVYENDIGEKLLEHEIMIKQVCIECRKYEKFSAVREKCPVCNVKLKLTAGSGTEDDIILKHKGNNISVEVKNSARDPDWGQCELIPTLKNGVVTWDYSSKAKKTKSKLLEYYSQYKFKDGSIGVLNYLNNKKFIPNKYRISDEKMTFNLRKGDQRGFEDTKHKISTLAFAKFHDKKSKYVQIGKKYGFYHINNDSANLGTEQFEAIFTLRFRAKTIQRHFPLCPKCGKECTPGTEPKCSSCKIEIPKHNSIGHKCPTCLKFEKRESDKNKIVPYKKFNHRDDKVEFVVTMVNPKIDKKSKFNIEKNDGQAFPLIEQNMRQR
jgi:hypothetical protein